MLLCPVCSRPLREDEDRRGASCAAGHHFDRAREGYLNLLRSSKAGDRTGDPKSQARSRRDFLDRGYYQPLRDALVDLVRARVESAATESAGTARPASPRPLTVLDICCGEGYYTSALGAIPGADVYGFDLSKEMVRLAAKRGGAAYFVANMKAIPVADASVDVATHLFAPFNEREFARVLRPGGTLFSVVPGARHLFGLKEVLYRTPYLNDEKLPEPSLPKSSLPSAGAEPGPTTALRLVGTTKIAAQITLATPADIDAVFQMTPYYYRTSESDRRKLDGIETLETPIEFVVGEYRRE